MRFKEGFGPDGASDCLYLTVRGLNEIEFIQIMDRRANDPFWKRIDAIQTGLKYERG